jgi:hypothetical protein
MEKDGRPSVLVVIADPQLRRLVGWLVGELDLPYMPVARWHEGVAVLAPRPSLLLCEIDDLDESPLAFAALAAHGWDAPVPLIILNRSADVEAIAGAFGAVAGLRKPIDVARLMSVIQPRIPFGPLTRSRLIDARKSLQASLFNLPVTC